MDLSTEALRNFLADIETQSVTGRIEALRFFIFRLEVGFEQVLLVFVRNTDAKVFHLQLDLNFPFAIALRVQNHINTIVAVGKLDGIGEQVQKNLLHPHLVED